MRLVINDGNRVRSLVLGEAALTIGRGPHNDLVVDEPGVAQSHCVLQGAEDGFELKDLKSGRGTYLNGVRASKRRLRPGDIVQFGATLAVACQDGAGLDSAWSVLDEQNALTRSAVARLFAWTRRRLQGEDSAELFRAYLDLILELTPYKRALLIVPARGRYRVREARRHGKRPLQLEQRKPDLEAIAAAVRRPPGSAPEIEDLYRPCLTALLAPTGGPPRPCGILQLSEPHPGGRPPGEAELQLLKAAIHHLSVAFSEDRRLDRRAPARRGVLRRVDFQALLKARYRSALETRSPLAIACIDLDGLARINARLGREAGDRALAELELQLRKAARPRDLLARFDSAVYVLALWRAGELRALERLEALRALCAETRLGQGLRAQVSAGLAAFSGEGCQSETLLLGRAQTALNRAKREGRNRIAVWRPRRPVARGRSQTKLIREVETILVG